MKDSCDNKYFQDTILELRSKAINPEKAWGTKKNRRQTNAAITTADADTTMKVEPFT